MNVLIVDNQTTLLKKLEQLIPGEKTIVRWNEFSPEFAKQFNVIVLSGGSFEPLIGNEKDFAEELAFIKSSQKPIIGICFGCELIIEAFGGKLRELEKPHKGIRSVYFLNPEFWNHRSSIEVYENHRWIMDGPLREFEILAKSKDGSELIKHKTKPLYGFQFHPENLVDDCEGDELFKFIFDSFT